MKSFSICLVLIFLVPTLVSAATGEAPRRIFADEPAGAAVTLDLKELWRAGGEDEDVIFGRITDIKSGPDGTIYVLDNQLCQVQVFSSDGQYLRSLSREGDGPGELRQPVEMAFLSDDILGIGMGFPGKVITLKLDGTPDRTYYPIGIPADGDIGLLMGFQFRDGMMAACGGRMKFNETGQGSTLRFLSLCQGQCETPKHLIEKDTPLDLSGQRFVEADDYFFERAWALGPDGTIFAAPLRDSYQVSRLDKSGATTLEFGRQYQARKRTREEKQEVRPVININSNENMEIIAEDHDPCISRILYNSDENTVWVQTSRGSMDPPEGVMQQWDIFSTEGEYLRQVNIAPDEEIKDAAVFLVGDGKIVILKGSGSSFSEDEPEQDNPETEPLEIICYEVR